MKTLEELLNALIDKWWKPRWFEISNPDYSPLVEYSVSDLCSIESWLWQFVCEKELFIRKSKYDMIRVNYNVTQRSHNTKHFEFWIMLSSIQEDKEKFLLDNIKI